MHPAPRPVDVHVPPPLRFLSPTKLRTYATCPLQYRHRYVDRLQSPYTPASLIGQAIHETLESNFRAKKHTRRDLPLAEAREVFDRVWERHAPGPASAADVDDPWEAAYADGLRALEHYLTKPPRHWCRTLSSIDSGSRSPACHGPSSARSIWWITTVRSLTSRRPAVRMTRHISTVIYS